MNGGDERRNQIRGLLDVGGRTVADRPAPKEAERRYQPNHRKPVCGRSRGDSAVSYVWIYFLNEPYFAKRLESNRILVLALEHRLGYLHSPSPRPAGYSKKVDRPNQSFLPAGQYRLDP